MPKAKSKARPKPKRAIVPAIKLKHGASTIGGNTTTIGKLDK